MLSSSAQGRASEYRASIYLMDRGYHVYDAITNHTPDLIAYHPDTGEIIRVEVKSLGSPDNGGKRRWRVNKNQIGHYDIILVVSTDTVTVIDNGDTKGVIDVP